MQHQNTQTPRQAAETRAPDFLAWHVSQKGEKSYWNKVGAAWVHKDARGYSLQLESLPLGGRIVLRQPLDEAQSGHDASDGARS